jgi:hypothetical protein
MAALRHSLQRELFSPSEERLVGLVHVTSVGKKKKALPCFLCVAVTPDQSIGAVIYKVNLSIIYLHQQKVFIILCCYF